MQGALLAFACAIVGQLPMSVLGLYNRDSAVLDISGITLEKKIQKAKYVALVEFYAPWCGHCKQLAPTLVKTAESLKGIAKVIAINCDEEGNKPVCGKYDVKGFPTLKLFPSSLLLKGKKKEPLDYNGPRTKKGISDFIVNAIPNIVKEVVSSDKDSKTVKNIDKFLEIKTKDGTILPKALLFTDKSGTTPLYRSLAIEFSGRASFGIIRKSDKSLVEKYNINEFPTLLIIPTKDSQEGETSYTSPEKFEGKLQFQEIEKFISKYVSSDKKKSNKADSDAEVETDGAEEEGSETEQKVELEPFDPHIINILEQDDFDKECLAQSGVCILNLIKPGQEEALIDYMSASKKELYDLKASNQLGSNSPKLRYLYSVITPSTFLMKQYELPEGEKFITLVLQPKRKLFAFMAHSEEAEFKTKLSGFVKDTLLSKVKFYQYGFTPKIKKVKKSKAEAKPDSDKDEL